MTSKIFKYLRILAVFLIVFIVFLSLPEFCSGHDHHHEHGHEHHDHDHDHDHPHDGGFKYTKEANEPYSQQSEFSSPPQRPRKQMSISRLWMEALSSTLIISIAPFLILFFMPLNHRRGHESLLKVLLSFASGGLLGDAFLHLIPHALQPHSHDHDHSHQHDSHSHGHEHGHGHEHSHDSTGAWVLAGILAFLILDKCMRLVKGHSHAHGHAEPALLNDEDEKDEKEEQQSAADDDNADAKSESDEVIQSTAFLNLIVDFVHNLTDGLAIGASYLAGETVGLVTTITVLIHEVPHEIGDFAILVQSGCSKKKAMLFQLVTALGAFLGTFISLVSGGGVDTEASSWALPFTAGGFIYISTVSIIPELLTDSSFTQSIKEVLALLTGVSLMALVALFE